MHACVISRMGINRRLEKWREGRTPTLSLCLAWIPILCGINRCFKAKKKKRCWLSFWICRHFSLPHWERAAFFSLSLSFWCELHSGQRSICRCPRIPLLKTPLSAVGMSCKVQVKSSSQWECKSLLGDAHLPLCTSPRPQTRATLQTINFLHLLSLCKLTLTFNSNPYIV